MGNAERPLGKKTEEVLDAIRDHLRRCSCPPTIRELGKATGISSTSVINYHLEKLIARGLISRPEFNTARSMVLPDAWMQFAGDEVVGETAGGERVVVRVIEPVAVSKAA